MRVLVIAPRGLHAGYVGCYGNRWIDTPALDRLAAEGVVFDHHFADRPDTDGARLAWLTGRHHFPTPDAEPTSESDLIRDARNHGVRTVLIHDGEPWGDGWEEVRHVEEPLDAVPEIASRFASDEKVLIWVDTSVLLPPWDVPDEFADMYCRQPPPEAEEEEEPEEFGEDVEPLFDPPSGPCDRATFIRVQRTYAAAVTMFDDVLGSLLETLRENDQLEDWLLIVTTSHGLSLGEHGVIGPEAAPHEELVHLPLIMRQPRGERGGRRIAALTQSVDLVPTLLEAWGVPVPEVHGRSLWPLVRGEAEKVRDYACIGHGAGDEIEWALRSPEWMLLVPIQPPAEEGKHGPRLYVKPDDRWEVNDVRQHHLELAEGMERVLRTYVEAAKRPGPLQPPSWPEEPSPEPGT